VGYCSGADAATPRPVATPWRTDLSAGRGAVASRAPAANSLPATNWRLVPARQVGCLSTSCCVPGPAPMRQPQPPQQPQSPHQWNAVADVAELRQLPDRIGREHPTPLARSTASPDARSRRPESSSCLRHPWVVAQTQPRERLRCLALHCADGATEHVGRRSLGEVFVKPEHKHCALPWRQRRQ